MTLAEAERQARSHLYRLAENTDLWEHKADFAKMLRETGSRAEQQYGERPGRLSAHYVEAVPAWFLALENAEEAEYILWCAVHVTRDLLAYVETAEPELFDLYTLKYCDKIPFPDLRQRFDRKLKRLDQDLIFMLILWNSWPVDKEGGESYYSWCQKRGY